MTEKKIDEVGLSQDDYNAAVVNIFTKIQESLEIIAETMEKQLQLDQDAMKQSMEAMEDEKKWREENGGPMDFSPPPTYNISDPDEDKS